MTEFYPYIYDLILAAAVGIFLFIGRRHGAARMLFLIAGVLCSLIAASVLSSVFAQFFFDNFMRERLIESVVQALPDSSTLTELLRTPAKYIPAEAAPMMEAVTRDYEVTVSAIRKLG